METGYSKMVAANSLAAYTKELALASSYPDEAQVTTAPVKMPMPSNTQPAPAAPTTSVMPSVIVMEKPNPEGTPQLKADTYFPINIYPAGSANTNTTAPTGSGTTPLTDEQKRQRAILIVSLTLVLLVILIVFMSYKSGRAKAA